MIASGDAVHLGRQNVHDGVATIRTEKSGFKTVVTLPILPVLENTLKNYPTGDLVFICSSDRQPFTKESLSNRPEKLATGRCS